MGRSSCSDVMGLKKGPWTPEEDQKLVTYIQNHGQGNWRALPKLAGLNRCGKSCRLRWTNYLRPGIKRGRFSQEEEQTILGLHAILGNKWSAIASHLPGRTDNEVKNFWNTRLKKKLIEQGYDPMTHQPITYDILSTIPQLIALANLNEFLDNKSYWDHYNAATPQDYVSQIANFQCLQHNLMMPQSSTEVEANNNNSLLNATQFENTINSSSLASNNFQLFNDSNSVSFSHMPSLETPCAYESPLSNFEDTVQVPQSKALLCHGYSSPNSSPWLLSCSSSTTQSPSHVVPLLMTDNNNNNNNNNMADDYGASSNWPDLLLLEDPLLNEVIS